MALEEAKGHRTSCIYTLWRPEHTIFLWKLGKLALGTELLPLALPSFELLVRLDLAR